MSKIVGVHGINQEYRGENTIYKDWFPALKDGLNRAGVVNLRRVLFGANLHPPGCIYRITPQIISKFF